MGEGPQGLFLTRTPRNLRTSWSARIGRTVFVTALVALAAAMALRLYLEIRPFRVLASGGEVTRAQVDELQYVPRPPSWEIVYRFEAPDGFAYRGSETVPVDRLPQVNRTKPVDVTYLPDDPRYSRVGRVTGARVRSEIAARSLNLVFIAVMAGAAAVAVLLHRRRTWLVRHGAVVPGTVTAKEEEPGAGGGGDGAAGRRLVRYAFKPDGSAEEMSGAAEVSEEAFGRLRDGARELVFYDPRRPSRNILYAASPYEIDEI